MPRPALLCLSRHACRTRRAPRPTGWRRRSGWWSSTGCTRSLSLSCCAGRCEELCPLRADDWRAVGGREGRPLTVSPSDSFTQPHHMSHYAHSPMHWPAAAPAPLRPCIFPAAAGGGCGEQAAPQGAGHRQGGHEPLPVHHLLMDQGLRWVGGGREGGRGILLVVVLRCCWCCWWGAAVLPVLVEVATRQLRQ
jgi:hypothetical protein